MLYALRKCRFWFVLTSISLAGLPKQGWFGLMWVMCSYDVHTMVLLIPVCSLHSAECLKPVSPFRSIKKTSRMSSHAGVAPTACRQVHFMSNKTNIFKADKSSGSIFSSKKIMSFWKDWQGATRHAIGNLSWQRIEIWMKFEWNWNSAMRRKRSWQIGSAWAQSSAKQSQRESERKGAKDERRKPALSAGPLRSPPVESGDPQT